MKNRWCNLDSIDRNIISAVIVIVLLLAAMFGACIAADTVINWLRCEKYQTYMPEEGFAWSIWTYCLVEAPDGTFVDANDYFGMGRLGLFIDETE